MTSHNGTTILNWQGISNIARNHFMKLFGTTPTMSEEALHEVLKANHYQIPKEARPVKFQLPWNNFLQL